MKVRYFFSFLLLTLFLSSKNIYSQQLTKVRDVGIWTGIGVEYEFRKDFELSLIQDVRLFEDFTKVDKANTDLGFQYTINKNFKLGTNARYSVNRKLAEYYSHDFRMNYDLSFKMEIIDNLKFRYRLRFQQTYENLLTIKRYKVGGKESNLRNKFQVDYTIHDHQIYFSTEVFREMKQYRKPYFNKLRFILGSKWENKLGELNYAIAYERDLGTAHPLHYIFAKTYYTFKFKRKKKKKKDEN